MSEQSLQIKPRPHPLDEWEQGWLEHWSKAGTLGYELPKSDPAGEEAAFLTEVRSPDKETDRLQRIQHEFFEARDLRKYANSPKTKRRTRRVHFHLS